MRLLDLYCGEGLAAWGYWLSGCFSEIVGVDVADMSSRYSFDFVQADCLTLTYDFLMRFDFIHASPPCQAYSKRTPDKTIHPRLIKPTLLMLAAAGVPHVVENVEGSGAELKPTLRLYGFDVGLPMARVRYFRVSSAANLNSAIPADMCIDDCSNVSRLASANDLISPHGNKYVSRSELEVAFGLGCIPPVQRRLITREGIKQGIPPAMTMWIASRILPKFYIG